MSETLAINQSVTLRQALKLRRRYGTTIRQLREMIQTLNVSPTKETDVSARKRQIREALARERELVEELCIIKHAHMEANTPICAKLIQREELKGQIMDLRRVPTKEGERFDHRDAEGTMHTKHFTAAVPRDELHKIVGDLQNRLNRLDEEIDQHNTTTSIDISSSLD